MSTKQNTNTNTNEALNFIAENIDKLKILLCASMGDKPLKYKFIGKRSTKTVFMSVKLQYLINEYCIEHDVKIGDVIETAMVEYLTRHEWSDKISAILSDSNGKTGETG